MRTCDVRYSRMADAQQMPACAAIAVVYVEIVVPAVIGHQIFRMNRSAEPFEGIVVGIRYLQVVYLRAVSYRTEGDAVDLLVFLERISRKLYTDVAQDARIIRVVRTSVHGTRASLYLHDVFIVPGITT